VHGAVGRALLPAKEESPAKEPRLVNANLRRDSYYGVCRHVLAFFDAVLKQDAAGKAFLQ
jgi:hypothetical protein